MIEKVSDLRLFKRIVELGSLSAAAGDMGISPGSASLRLAAMERSIGATLFRRTTRQMHLTPAGEEFLELASNVLNDLAAFDEHISREKRELSGVIKVTAPVDLGRNYIAPSLDRFVEGNPGISVDLVCTDRVADLTERGIDIAVRYGALMDSSLRIRRISSNKRIPVAAPSYIERMGMPEHPKDLAVHDCMLLSSLGDKNDSWTFVENSKALTQRVTGSRATNDGEVLRRWALEGKGIALKSAWDVAEDINYGRLVPLLISYCPPNVDLQLVFPPLARQPTKVRRLADHLVRELKILDKCLETISLAPHYLNKEASSQS
ncbi:LysR family transcriptional regulator [Phaeobacter gallaeciensis]|uniref:LysR family transcriptional regulator n=1 Tax=Phaeobacter gallaeciensis TaxID=60890 RepID=UPI000BBBBB87|nr:LysR family transcriptional regulator [Phaeobacter gallaeciensis]ATF20652.1 transcriptional regulator, LysR family [Phaeobacter gallaeciensis]ATF24761.1 transcriptional regulator, LysR family [Phaeobacter gallaeciensis]